MSLSSALSISSSAGAPRIAFLDFPLGRTAGKRFDRRMQREVALRALGHIERARRPGEVLELPWRWAEDDDWKDSVMKSDKRIERFDTPQYQTEADEEMADPVCPTCIFPAG